MQDKKEGEKEGEREDGKPAISTTPVTYTKYNFAFTHLQQCQVCTPDRNIVPVGRKALPSPRWSTPSRPRQTHKQTRRQLSSPRYCKGCPKKEKKTKDKRTGITDDNSPDSLHDRY